MAKQADILASLSEVAGDTDEQKLAWLCEFYDAMDNLLIAHDVWNQIGTSPSDAAEYIAYHGLQPLRGKS